MMRTFARTARAALRKGLRYGIRRAYRVDRPLFVGCGAVLTLTVLAAAAIGVAGWFERCIDDWRAHFLVQSGVVRAAVERKQARLLQVVEGYETLRGFHKYDAVPAEALGKRLRKQRGAVAVESEIGATPLSVLSTLSGPRDSARLAALVRLIRAIAPASLAPPLETGATIDGFVFTEDRRFFATWPPLPIGAVDTARRAGIEATVARYVARVETELARYDDAVLKSRRVFWVPLHESELYGAPVHHYAVPVYRDGRRTAVIVVTVRAAHFPQLFERGLRDPDFFVVSRDGMQPLGEHAVRPRTAYWMRRLGLSGALSAATDEQARIVRDKGNWFVVERVVGPDWIAVYAFDWRTVVANLREPIQWTVVLVLMLLALLWALLAVISADARRRRAGMQRLRGAWRAAAEANRARSTLVAMIGHEIRTPLHGVLGNLELLAGEALTPPQAARLGAVRVGFGALVAVVDDVLDLQRIEAQALRLECAPVQLVDIVERCAQTFGSAIVGKGVQFICTVDPDLDGLWHVDGRRIGQILGNLLANAGKFTRQGRVVVRVARAQGSGDFSASHRMDRRARRRWRGPGMPVCAPEQIEITVADTGIGIAESALPRLFEPFLQADDSIARRFGGTGLGLALCRRLAGLMGGEIGAHSVEGAGSVFTVRLPLERLAADEAARRRRPRRPAARAVDAIVVAFAHPVWHAAMRVRIGRWFPHLTLIDGAAGPGALPAGLRAVLVFGGYDDMLPAAWTDGPAAFHDVIVVSAQGPLHPLRRDGAVHLTAFSTEQLKAALDALCARATPQRTRAACAKRAQRVPMARVEHRGARILAVDDCAVSLALLADQLRTLGYRRIDCATDGQQAFDLAVQVPYDVVLADLCMPRLDGHALREALRARGVSVPIVVHTAAPDAARELLHEGFAHVLAKPASLAAVFAALDAVLRAAWPDGAPRALMRPQRHAAPRHLHALFAQMWPDDAATMRRASERGDVQALLQQLHRVGGALRVLGERTAGERCLRLRASLERGGRHDVAAAIETLLREIDAIAKNGHHGRSQLRG